MLKLCSALKFRTYICVHTKSLPPRAQLIVRYTNKEANFKVLIFLTYTCGYIKFMLGT